MERKDIFRQQTGKFKNNEKADTNKIAKLNASSGIPRLEVNGKSKNLSNKMFGIGRDKSNALIISDPKVSRFHAVVYFEKGVAYIKDTDSSNGTFVNEEKIESGKKYELNNGDKIKVGTTVLNFYQ